MNTFVFIVQSGILEVQSILLAATLRKNINCHLRACFPSQFGQLHPLTRQIFKKMDVEIVEIKNDFNPVYPCGNKVSALLSTKPNETVMFLDSDIICTKQFDWPSKPTVVTTGRYDVITHLEWKNTFNLFNMDMPVVFEHIRSPLVLCDFEFAKRWHNNSKKIWDAVHSNKLSLRKIRQTDQISLTISVLQHGGFDILQWHNNELLQSPSEIYKFDNHGNLNISNIPFFVVLQKGWLYYSRQGHPKDKSENPNSLVYYPELRSIIYEVLSLYPQIDEIPAWEGVFAFYFSKIEPDNSMRQKYLRGVEGNQK